MKIIKKVVDIKNQNSVLSIVLENKKNPIGEDQSMNLLAENNSVGVINSVNDVETYKFKINSTGTTINFNFFSYTLALPKYFVAYFAGHVFPNLPDITTNVIQNSYFIMDIFDSVNIQTQIKLNRNYLTQLNPNFLSNTDLTSIFVLNKNTPNQLNNIFIPKKYLNSTINNKLYCRFMFYDALNGKIINFINESKLNSIGNDKLFFEITYNKNLKTWQFVETTINAIGDVYGSYSERLNSSLQTQTDKSEAYPTGSTFNYKTINYDVIL